MMGLASLPARDLDRLQKLAGLLGSDGDGERANAARMCTNLLREHGLTWRDALTPALPRVSVPPIPVTPMPDHQKAAAECLAWQEVLTSWEWSFCMDLRHLRRLSAKQSDTLDRIVDKVRRHKARAGAHG